MVVFEELFLESRGKPVEYNGRTIQMVDIVPLHTWQKVRLTFEKIGSDWKQGVMLKSKGEFLINEQRVKNSVVLWQDSAPRTLEFEIDSKDSKEGQLEVRNVWDTGDGTVHSWHAGAAIYVEEMATGKRYHCNDGHLDDDFSDLVFTIEMI